MKKYLLKDSASKNLIYHWLRSGIQHYVSNSRLHWNDEDSLCGHFFSSISGLCSVPTGTLNIRSYKVRGRGPAAREKKLGADGLGLISIKTQGADLAGFFLFQAKKAISEGQQLRGAKAECSTMLAHSPASYLLVLMPAEVKMVGAMAVTAIHSADPTLSNLPYVGFPRFMTEQVLHGLMLEPLAQLRETLSFDLLQEVSHVVQVTGGTDETIEDAMSTLNKQLGELDLDLVDHQVQ